MLYVIEFFRKMFVTLFELLDVIVFDFADFDVSLMQIFLGFILTGIIISVFWKGASG